MTLAISTVALPSRSTGLAVTSTVPCVPWSPLPQGNPERRAGALGRRGGSTPATCELRGFRSSGMLCFRCEVRTQGQVTDGLGYRVSGCGVIRVNIPNAPLEEKMSL